MRSTTVGRVIGWQELLQHAAQKRMEEMSKRADLTEDDVRDAYIDFKMKGDTETASFFHYTLATLDIDWPHGGPLRRNPSENLQCPKCKRWLYRNACITPYELKAHVKHINSLPQFKHKSIKLKSISWTWDHDCEGPHPWETGAGEKKVFVVGAGVVN